MGSYEHHALEKGAPAEWLRELADMVEKVEEERDALLESVKELEAEVKGLLSEIKVLESTQP